MVWDAVVSLGFDSLAIILASAYGAVVLSVFLACLVSVKVRAASKRPFFHITNCFSALALALLATYVQPAAALAFTAVFWLVGYMFYGLLCAVTGRAAREKKSPPVGAAILTPSSPVPSPRPQFIGDVPAAKNNVRLEHALSIADKLLLKNLSRGDRQELEKMKTSLTVMKVKGEISPQEGEILNEQFNALLKLMAKYNV